MDSKQRPPQKNAPSPEADSPSQIIDLSEFRRRKLDTDEEYAYRARILVMEKAQLLEEMVAFQQERSRVGQLTRSMMVRGKYLFRALEERAETNELRILARSYRRHLEFELDELAKSGGSSG